MLAAESGNEQLLLNILAGDKELASLGDEAEDRIDREQFAQKYQQMHRLVREPDGTTRLYVGPENRPFPVPLVSRATVWYFDAETGAQEIRFRRLGENEHTAIETCRALGPPQLALKIALGWSEVFIDLVKYLLVSLTDHLARAVTIVAST
ncbi:MAG: uncharacterized protein JWQ49_5119 [Edaphobacter sp.]|nr:uncharacterized protein [Edaphobacter sp.]